MKPSLASFYLLGLYVLLQFSWWAYLLVELNQEIYRHKMEHVISGEADEQRIHLEEQLHQRWWMIAGEGAVFLAILVFGIYKTRQSLRDEFALARQQKNFLLSITHEFKSPLAAIKLNLQTLMRRELPKEKQLAMLTAAVEETDRINALIENSLLAARLESSHITLQKEIFNLSEYLEMWMKNRTAVHAHPSRLEAGIEPGLWIQGDPLAITSLVGNLVENAEKYSPEAMPVVLSLKKEKNHAVLSVADYGAGISEEDKDKIFQKFYRVGNEETRDTKGTGLGLFIVKHIVHYHGGTIRVLDNQPVGTVFKVTLPLKSPETSA